MSAKLQSHIPEIVSNAQRGVSAALDASADRIKTGAKTRVAKDKRDLEKAIRVVRTGQLERAVTAHSRRAFYGHLIEWGSVRKAARPFMTPAAEAEAATGRLLRDIAEVYTP